MPPEGIERVHHSGILTFDEIVSFTKTAVLKGIDKLRITGGEPLVRKGITDLVKELASIPGIKDLSMTSNGILLERYAFELKRAGLMRVNVSLDTTNKERYREITRGGDIDDVFRGIDAAKRAGLIPVKLNCVVNNNSDEPDALLVKKFASGTGLNVRFITRMELSKGTFEKVEGGDGGDCENCNRLRLTSTGILKPCLFSDIGINIREYGAESALEEALRLKPSKGVINSSGSFYNLGG